MRCPACQHDNRPDRRFCTECGARLPASCPSCGAATESGEKFCGDCGAALTSGAAAAPVHSPSTPVQQHLADNGVPVKAPAKA